MSKQLPSQLVSLVHHIALNEAGWWDKTIQNLITSAVWLNELPSTIHSITKDLLNNFGVKIELETLESNINVLLDQTVIVENLKGKYKLSETSRKKFEIDLKSHEDLISNVKKHFIEAMKSNCLELNEEECWNSFNEGLLIPTISQLGAKTYELISGNKTSIEQTPVFQNYLETYDENMRSGIKKVIISFFDPNNSNCKDFILRMINSFFCLEAGNLSSESLTKINKIQNKEIEFYLFIDTNFLFSILNLHDNPSNEAAISLKNLIQTIKNKVKVRFYVTKKTMEEATNVLEYQKNKLNGIALTKNIIRAANNFDFSGFEKKYFEQINKTNKSISPDDYFSPYINNIQSTIKSQGVEYFNENIDQYNMDQRVLDDINLSQMHQKSLDKQKTYEQLRHDISLWYFIKDKRPKYIESHIDAKYWIVTIDFRFLGYDRFKGKGNNKHINLICMHPASLIQMLQFWVPRSKEFEDAILSNIRTPLFHTEFDNDSELIANEILKRLSRFEDLEDLSEETITSVLYNEALRNKMKSTKNVEEQIDLIKNAIIEENKRISIELEKEKLEKKSLQSLLVEKDKESTEKDDKIKELEGRIQKIENEKEIRDKYNSDYTRWEDKKNTFIETKWIEFKKSKWILFIFLFIWFLLAGILILFLLFIDNKYLKFSPIVLLFINTIINFFNKDRIKISCQLLFSPKKIQRKKIEEFAKEFPDKEPVLKIIVMNGNNKNF